MEQRDCGKGCLDGTVKMKMKEVVKMKMKEVVKMKMKEVVKMEDGWLDGRMMGWWGKENIDDNGGGG